MAAPFDADAIEKHGWRQGAVLGEALKRLARDGAPRSVSVADDDWFIVTSHDCDVVSPALEKEPVVEILRAEIVQRDAPDKQQAWGRNPRQLQLAIELGDRTVVLAMRVHERWTLSRAALCEEPPAELLGEKARRVVAEWLAKRYIRAAFPTAFDRRWRAKLRDWTRLLEGHSRWIQGVYLRLSSLSELDEKTPYKCHFIVAAPADARREAEWSTKRAGIERDIEAFWKQFTPGVECVGVEVLGTDELTLADIEPYQRFDADWVSFADDSTTIPPLVDMRT